MFQNGTNEIRKETTMAERISVEKAAKELNVSPLSLRYALHNGLVPFGTGFKQEGSDRYTYIIWPAKYREYVSGH